MCDNVRVPRAFLEALLAGEPVHELAWGIAGRLTPLKPSLTSEGGDSPVLHAYGGSPALPARRNEGRDPCDFWAAFGPMDRGEIPGAMGHRAEPAQAQ